MDELTDAEMRAFIANLTDGRYGIRVAKLDAETEQMQFPLGFSFRYAGKLVVLNPNDPVTKMAMGVVVHS